jgi:putative aminopeptidase FrvX
MDRIKLLQELTAAFGISGHENTISEILKKHFGDRVTVTRDGIGSLIAKKSGTAEKPKIMFAAHMDEIGFMVKSITKQGFMKFLTVGGWYEGNLPGLRVQVKTKNGMVPGVIGQKAIHDLPPEERKKMPKKDDMFIDVGATHDYDVKEKLGIRPGDPVVPDYPFVRLANKDLCMAKAWDDRVGCGLLVELLNNLSATEHPNTVYLTGTVQEEVGLRGARTSAFAVEPDIGFALDVSICRDTPGNDSESPEKLGSGVSILIHDSTMIPHTKLRDFVCDLAEHNNVPYHFTSLKGGYDTGVIQVTKYGVPCLAIGIPTRYVHSGSSIISMTDYEHVLNLITLIVKNLDADALKNILA